MTNIHNFPNALKHILKQAWEAMRSGYIFFLQTNQLTIVSIEDLKNWGKNLDRHWNKMSPLLQ